MPRIQRRGLRMRAFKRGKILRPLGRVTRWNRRAVRQYDATKAVYIRARKIVGVWLSCHRQARQSGGLLFSVTSASEGPAPLGLATSLREEKPESAADHRGKLRPPASGGDHDRSRSAATPDSAATGANEPDVGPR